MLYRSAPLPGALRRAPLEHAEQASIPPCSARRSAGCCARPRRSTWTTSRCPASGLPERLAVLRTLLRRGTFSFDEAVEGADRMTVAVTVFALLELYKRGEAAWEQDEPFGPITVRAETGRGRSRRRWHDESSGSSRRCSSSRRTPCRSRSSPMPCGVEEDGPHRARRAALALEGRGLVLREVGGGWALGSHPDAEESARRLLARPRTPGLTPAQAETLSIVAYLQPVSRPEVARIRGVASESADAARSSSAG